MLQDFSSCRVHDFQFHKQLQTTWGLCCFSSVLCFTVTSEFSSSHHRHACWYWWEEKGTHLLPHIPHTTEKFRVRIFFFLIARFKRECHSSVQGLCSVFRIKWERQGGWWWGLLGSRTKLKNSYGKTPFLFVVNCFIKGTKVTLAQRLSHFEKGRRSLIAPSTIALINNIYLLKIIINSKWIIEERECRVFLWLSHVWRAALWC